MTPRITPTRTVVDADHHGGWTQIFGDTASVPETFRPVEKRNFYPPYLHLAPLLGVTPLEFRRDFFASVNYSVWAIVCRCLRDSTFSCFGTVSACDGQIHRRTDGQTRDDIKLRASMDGVARQKFSSRRETVRYTSYRIIILVPSISGLEVTLKSVTRGQCNARPTVTFPAA